ncbi:MAG: DNA polymerase/3'-5' exonuclease PolX [Proteobacteria bacterium]|nr:DNA polymerase/3'-5' exonuclease PolX [Pseudomonadota bacterium]
MPVHNAAIADAFDEIADLLELTNANPFRVRAYRRAAQTVRGQSRELWEDVEAGRDLKRLPGIGEDLAGKIAEIVSTRRCALLEELRSRVAPGQVELLRLPGLGPKRVRQLRLRHRVQTPAQLRAALAAGRRIGVPGAATATGARLVAALEHRGVPVRMLRNDAAPIATALERHLRAVPDVATVVVAGSYRRGRETVGDLDVLVSSEEPAAAIDAFCRYDEVRDVVARGRTRAAVVLLNGLAVDLRVVPAAGFGAALHYFTGNKAHNIRMRNLARRAGLKLNEYGLFRGRRRVAGRTEEEVFAAVGLPWIAPELREDRGEIDAARAGRLPALVRREDLRGDLHVHTEWSDGSASIEAMARAARAAGLSYIGIADHSRYLGATHGLDADALRRQSRAIDAVSVRGITVLKGIEVDILEDGSLALADEVLAGLDYVIGAAHGGFGLDEQRQTRRLLRALDHPHLTILAHPRGRLINERPPMTFDLAAVLARARERRTWVELNCQPSRLDLPDVDLALARASGVPVAVGSDAHGVGGFALLEPGLLQARRGGLEARDVVNTLPLGRLRAALARGR